MVQRHRFRSGSATGFAVAARSLNNQVHNVLFNRRRLPTRWGQRLDDQLAKEGQKAKGNSSVPTSMQIGSRLSFPKLPCFTRSLITLVNIPKSRFYLYLRVLWLIRVLIIAPSRWQKLCNSKSARRFIVGVWPPVALFCPKMMQTSKLTLGVEPL